MVTMKTLTIGGKTYEIFDDAARTAIANLPEYSKVTAISVVKAENTITITATESGVNTVHIITLDENGYPTKIATDNTECSISWEGF